MEYLREGDCLVITRLDRLARSVLDLAKILARFEQEGINLLVIDQSIDTATSSGKLLFNMLAAVAEFENALRRERQQECIEKAKANKVKFGRRSRLNDELIGRIVTDKNAGLPILVKENDCIKGNLLGVYSNMPFYCKPG
jgi:DNA invertase Pin-like site-specific DNA recombinase